MYTADEYLAADDEAFGPFADDECWHERTQQISEDDVRCLDCGAVSA